jgi:hypothetical protein
LALMISSFQKRKSAVHAARFVSGAELRPSTYIRRSPGSSAKQPFGAAANYPILDVRCADKAELGCRIPKVRILGIAQLLRDKPLSATN